MTLFSEIQEQPESLRRLLNKQRSAVEEIAEIIRASDVRYAFIAARGTSDNAARYANYLWGAMNRLPVALATPSLFTYYNRPPHLRGAFVIGISQSGMSPDIVSVVAEGKKQRCPTLAITNNLDSPLASEADFVLDIQAGQEKAVAATKTYSAELMAIAMLAAALESKEANWNDLARVPDWVQSTLNENLAGADVEQYRSMTNCIVLGRGFSYPTAYEWALKLKELTYVQAQSYSSADFMHGPIAMVNTGSPVLAVVPSGAVYSSTLEVLKNLQNARASELILITDMSEAMKLAQTGLRLPQNIPEWLNPLVSIIPAQLFCYRLAVAKGCNTESPRGIHKVTETR